LKASPNPSKGGELKTEFLRYCNKKENIVNMNRLKSPPLGGDLEGANLREL